MLYRQDSFRKKRAPRPLIRIQSSQFLLLDLFPPQGGPVQDPFLTSCVWVPEFQGSDKDIRHTNLRDTSPTDQEDCDESGDTTPVKSLRSSYTGLYPHMCKVTPVILHGPRTRKHQCTGQRGWMHRGTRASCRGARLRDKYSGSTQITTHLDLISHSKTTSGRIGGPTEYLSGSGRHRVAGVDVEEVGVLVVSRQMPVGPRNLPPVASKIARKLSR
jgi:hypothetical protein